MGQEECTSIEHGKYALQLQIGEREIKWKGDMNNRLEEMSLYLLSITLNISNVLHYGFQKTNINL